MARKLQCIRSVRRLWDAPAIFDPDVRQYGMWSVGEVDKYELLKTILDVALPQRVTLLAARYVYHPPQSNDDPLLQRDYSAIKVYYKEGGVATEQVEENTQGR